MVDFVHPFPGRNPGDTLTKAEIIRALRLSLCAEEEATQLYDLISEYVDDEKIKKIMTDVANEEQVHIGEFQKLLNIYEEDEVEKLEEGFEEAEEKLKESFILKKLALGLEAPSAPEEPLNKAPDIDVVSYVFDNETQLDSVDYALDSERSEKVPLWASYIKDSEAKLRPTFEFVITWKPGTPLSKKEEAHKFMTEKSGETFAEEKLEESKVMQSLTKHAGKIDHVKQFLEAIKAAGGDIDFALKQIAMFQSGNMSDLHDSAIHLIDLKSSSETKDTLSGFFD